MSGGKCPFLAQLEAQERLLDANYEDGVSEIVADHADPVEVSMQVFDQDGDMSNSADLSTLFTTFGQFLDHDLVLTPEGHSGEVLDLIGMPHDIDRSDIADGTGETGPIAPANVVTWQIDGSQIYGSTEARETDLRSFEDGRLLTTEDASSARDLLPDATPDTIMAGDITSDDPVYLAGDVRANENPNLLSMHTLFVREHNYWAEQLSDSHADWTDDQLFDGARQIVEFELQQITYTEWLPHLIGGAVSDDWDHDASLSGQVSVEFSTAAFRFGHTLVSSSLDQMNDDGTDGENGGLLDNFFNDAMVQDHGIDALLRGQLSHVAQELDAQIVDDLNFFLSTPDGISGFSLAAINIARGYDHGLQNYVAARAALIGDIDPDALDPSDFSLITDDVAVQEKLAAVYDDVFQVELWVGGLAEDHVPGTQLGPLFTYIVAEQFTRTRAADDTFGQLDDSLGADIIAQVRDSRFADIIERNTDVDMVQEDVFVASDRSVAEAEMPDATWQKDQIAAQALSLHGDLRTKNGDDTVSLSGGTHLEGSLKTGQGHDTVTMSSGWITGDIATGRGDDTVTLSGTAKIGDDIRTGSGDDNVTLSDMARVGDDISTGDNDDMVTLNDRATVAGSIKTGRGDDQVTLGARTTVAEAVMTGKGDDVIRLAAGADVAKINGGKGTDTLHVDGPFRVEYDADDDTSGTIYHQQPDGTEIATRFCSVERIICFTPGTRIITATGVRRIDDLAVGDRVWTLDHGLQPLRWIGRTTVPARGDLAPIRIRKGALGNDHDLRVSPQHRMLLDGWRVELHCATPEVLAPARGLVNDSTIRPDPGTSVTYIHLAFDRHQIVMAEGIPTESFYPGAEALNALDRATRDEVLRLFPEWRDGRPAPIDTARPVLTVGETRAIADRS